MLNHSGLIRCLRDLVFAAGAIGFAIGLSGCNSGTSNSTALASLVTAQNATVNVVVSGLPTSTSFTAQIYDNSTSQAVNFVVSNNGTTAIGTVKSGHGYYISPIAPNGFSQVHYLEPFVVGGSTCSWTLDVPSSDTQTNDYVTVMSADAINLTVTCTPNTHTVGGTVDWSLYYPGLIATQSVQLSVNGTLVGSPIVLTVPDNAGTQGSSTTFSFPTALSPNDTYSIVTTSTNQNYSGCPNPLSFTPNSPYEFILPTATMGNANVNNITVYWVQNC